MCGRYAFFDAGDFSKRYFVDEGSLDFSSNYNISPGSLVPIVTKNSPNKVYMMKWGLIPSWSKKFKMSFKTFNARLENLTKSRLFAALLRNKRCLVPANGFYEWNQKNGKEPHYIVSKNQELFSFAGLYDVWEDVEGKKFYTFTIITTAANSFMKKIHSRMPVILDKKDEKKWVDNSNTDVESVMGFLGQYKPLKEHIVSKDVNNASNNFSSLVEKA